MPVEQYCAVICPDGSLPYQVICPSAHNLAELLQKLIGNDIYAFPYYGVPWAISKGPRKHLMSPDGDNYPLFSLEDDLTPDPTGSLYTK